MGFFSQLKKWGIIKMGTSTGTFDEFPEYDPLNQNFVNYGKGQKKPGKAKDGNQKNASSNERKMPWRIAIVGWILIAILVIRGLALCFDTTFVRGFLGIFLYWIFMLLIIRLFIRFIKGLGMFIFFLVIVVFMFIFPYMIGHDQKSGTGMENNDTKEAITKTIDCDALIQKYNNKVYRFTTSDTKLQGEFGIIVNKNGDKCTYRRGVSFKLNEQLPSNYATVNRESRSTPQNYIAKVYYKDDGEDGFGTTALFPAFCQKDKMPDPFADWRATDIYTNCSANNSTTTPSDVLYSHRSNESNDMDATDEEIMKRFFSAYQFDIYDASAFVECKPQEIGGTTVKSCTINFDKTISESSPIRTYTLKTQE